MPTKAPKSVDLPVLGLPIKATVSVASSRVVDMFSNGKSIAQRYRYDGNAQSVVGPETNLVPGHANDARISRAEHFNAGSAPQTKFL